MCSDFTFSGEECDLEIHYNMCDESAFTCVMTPMDGSAQDCTGMFYDKGFWN